jgi:hypothetical protein
MGLTLVISSVLLFCDGLGYGCMGACVLWPVLCGNSGWCQRVSHVYLGMFKECVLEPDDQEGQGTKVPLEAFLVWRLVAYLLILMGVCRVVASFNWGCGYVLLGLGTCVAEMAFLCNELLCHDAARLHRAVGFILLNTGVSLLYIGMALPNCSG